MGIHTSYQSFFFSVDGRTYIVSKCEEYPTCEVSGTVTSSSAFGTNQLRKPRNIFPVARKDQRNFCYKSGEEMEESKRTET